jgi:hypothetical protein
VRKTKEQRAGIKEQSQRAKIREKRAKEESNLLNFALCSLLFAL